MTQPLVMHVVHRFGMGGMENGMVNLLNHMGPSPYRHVVVCLSGFDEFRARLDRDDIRFFDLEKKPGHDLRWYGRLYRLVRELRPDIMHTRNLSTLEAQFVAVAAGVPGRVHGEHGRDVFDLHGKSRKYNLLRRAARPFIHRYIAVSRDLASWLATTVGVARERVSQIYSGVDAQRFHVPAEGVRADLAGHALDRKVVIGSVGRMVAVKDYPTLARAFIRACEICPAGRDRMFLAIAGDGESRSECQDLVAAAGLASQAWFPGSREDVPEFMRSLDVFVLPSLGEGVSNTVLEAMASGLPVVATRVGGNPELVEDGITGALVPAGDVEAMARALLRYADDTGLRRQHGAAARSRIESAFSLDRMVAGYLDVYEVVLRMRRSPRRSARGARRPA
jgi:sugar transferase (PEP-CTERM/EpsH1 system associated)